MNKELQERKQHQLKRESEGKQKGIFFFPMLNLKMSCNFRLSTNPTSHMKEIVDTS